MKRCCYLLFVILLGCNYNENIQIGYEKMDVENSLSRTIDNPWDTICDLCTAFNSTYSKYEARMSEGLTYYLKKGGCCKSCFEKSFDKYYKFNERGMYADEIQGQIIQIKKSGKSMRCPECEPHQEHRNSLLTAMNAWLMIVNSTVADVIEYGSKEEWCRPKPTHPSEETENEENEENGESGSGESGGSSGETPHPSIPSISSWYRDVLMMNNGALLQEIGGEVENNWIVSGFDFNILRICYALHMADLIDPNAGVELLGQPDADGRIYFISYNHLYRYLSVVYGEPKLLTLSELRNKGNNYGALIMDKRAVGSSYDDDIFGDIWEDGGFLSEKPTRATEFYCWTFL